MKNLHTSKRIGLAVVLMIWITAASLNALASELYLKDFTAKAIDTATIRLSWESNDPPYTITCSAKNGFGFIWKEKNELFNIEPVTTYDLTASFGREDFNFTDTWLSPNTEYHIVIVSNSGLMCEKFIKTQKPKTYSAYGGEAKLYLLDPQYQSYDDFDLNSLEKNPDSYFRKKEEKLKYSLEQVRAYGFRFCPWMTIHYRNKSDEHFFNVRILLRIPSGKVIYLWYTVPPTENIDEARANQIWYLPLSDTTTVDGSATQVYIGGEYFTEIGKYAIEVYFDEYLADTRTLTVY